MQLSKEDRNKINEIKKIRDELLRIKNYADNDINKRETIDLYHRWRTESEMFLEKYFPEDNRWMKKFSSYTTDGNGYVLIDSCFTPQLPILNSLLDQIEGNIVNTKQTENKIQEIFISHSSEDEEIVQAFVDLILDNGLTIKPTNIFCTSLDGMKIKSGEEWRDFIKERLMNTKITFLIITPNYKESEICLNEMGAAWVLNAIVIPLAVEPINYESVGVIMEVRQVEKILDGKALDRIKDIVREKLDIDPREILSDRWTEKKTEFITKVKNILVEKPFKKPLVREEFDKQSNKINELEITVTSQLKEKEKLSTLIEKLERTKDRKEVIEVKKKLGFTSEFQEFNKLLTETRNILDDFHPIIRGIFFKEFNNKNIDVNASNYPDEINEAVSRNIIDEDLIPLWDSNETPHAIEVNEALTELCKFMTKNLSTQFYDEYKAKYESPFELGNIDFWDDVIKAKVYIY